MSKQVSNAPVSDEAIVAIITAAKKAGTPLKRIGISGGLFLDKPLTSAVWRMRYVFGGKPNHLTFKAYSPAIKGNNLKAALVKRDEALAILAGGNDPGAQRNEKRDETKAQVALDRENKARLANGDAALLSFEHLGELFITHCEGHMAQSTCDALRQRAKLWVYPYIGQTHIAKVTKAQALVITQKIEAQQKWDTLGKVRRFIEDTYDYAATKYLELGLPENLSCPVVNDKFLFVNKPTVVNRKAVIDDKAKFNTAQSRDEATDLIHKLVLDINNSPAHLDANPTQGLLLMFLTGQRTINIAHARKADFDLDAGRWVIPGDDMKGSVVAKRNGEIKDQLVMLSTYAVALVREQFAAYPDSEWVFPGKPKGHKPKGGIVLTGKPMNEKAMNKRLHHLGYKDVQTGHGLRAIVKTGGHRLAGNDPVVLEATLAHKAAMKHIEDGGMRGVYSRDIDDGIDPVVHQREAQLWGDWLFAPLAPQKPVLTLVATLAPADQLKAA